MKLETSELKDFYEKLYFHELEVREKIEGRMQIPLTIFAIAFAMIGYLARESVLLRTHSIDSLFWGLFVAAIATLLIAMAFFVMASYGYKYRNLPTTRAIDDYFDNMLATYKEVSPADARRWTNSEFNKYLLATFRDYGTINTINNDKKATYIHRCMSALFASIILSAASFFPYYNEVYQSKMEATSMANERPAPPPPPPPPPRDVRGEPIPSPKPR